MAKSKKKIRKITQKNSSSLDSIKKPEFWTGLVTVLVVIALAWKLFPLQSICRIAASRTVKATPNHVAKIISRAPISSAPYEQSIELVSTVTPVASPTALMDTPVPTAAVPTTRYTVQEGDNYYKISVKVCGKGKYFETIQAENNAQPLHKGDEIVVDCSL